MDVLRLSVPNEYLKAVFSLYSRYTISVQLIRYETTAHYTIPSPSSLFPSFCYRVYGMQKL